MLEEKQTARCHSDWFIWCCKLMLQWWRCSGCGALHFTLVDYWYKLHWHTTWSVFIV